MAKELVTIEEPVTTEEFNRDLEYVRENQLSLIEQGQKAFEEVMNIAEQSQHPRAYEVLGTFMRTLSELNKDLLNTSEKKKDVKIQKRSSPEHVTQNLFVGSTKDLQELLKKHS